MPAILGRDAPTVSPSSSLSPSDAPAPSQSPSPSGRLRTQFAAARVSFTWLGVRKALSAEQKERAAESFGAEGAFLSAGKKLLDTRHRAFKAVTSVRHCIYGYWKSLSLPYPEPGVRLIRQDAIEAFARQLAEFKAELDAAVEELDGEYSQLQAAARKRLGSLYDATDYPASLRGLFDVSWDFPSVEPPEYLLRLNPKLYEEERQRISARFDEAVRWAEEAFTTEFAALVSHLVDRLTPGADGQKKVFRDTAVGNLAEFFTRFKQLNVHSSAELDQLVETARRAVEGVEPGTVRDNDALRQRLASQLASVRASLDPLLVDQPRRRILRPIREGVR